MIVMSASQLKPDVPSIVEELCQIIEVKPPASVVLQDSAGEAKSDRFQGENPVEEIK